MAQSSLSPTPDSLLTPGLPEISINRINTPSFTCSSWDGSHSSPADAGETTVPESDSDDDLFTPLAVTELRHYYKNRGNPTTNESNNTDRIRSPSQVRDSGKQAGIITSAVDASVELESGGYISDQSYEGHPYVRVRGVRTRRNEVEVEVEWERTNVAFPLEWKSAKVLPTNTPWRGLTAALRINTPPEANTELLNRVLSVDFADRKNIKVCLEIEVTTKENIYLMREWVSYAELSTNEKQEVYEFWRTMWSHKGWFADLKEELQAIEKVTTLKAASRKGY